MAVDWQSDCLPEMLLGINGIKLVINNQLFNNPSLLSLIVF